MENDPILTIADFSRVFCVPGIRARFLASGVDYEDFVRNGAPASHLKGHGYDALIDRVIKSKRSAEEGVSRG